MKAYEFKAQVKNGTIQIPQKFTRQIGSTVRVIILAEHEPEQADMIEDLMKNPVKIDNFTPLKRDEIYEQS